MIRFEFNEMVEILQAIGYQIKEESELVDESRYNLYEDWRERITWSVYLNGEKLNNRSPNASGRGVVVFIFERELHRRLRQLFFK